MKRKSLVTPKLACSANSFSGAATSSMTSFCLSLFSRRRTVPLDCRAAVTVKPCQSEMPAGCMSAATPDTPTVPLSPANKEWWRIYTGVCFWCCWGAKQNKFIYSKPGVPYLDWDLTLRSFLCLIFVLREDKSVLQHFLLLVPWLSAIGTQLSACKSC